MAAVRVALVCGSLSSVSANRRALDVVRAALVDAGHEPVDAVAVGDLPAFDPTGDATTSVDTWRSQIAAADAVVIATPEYAGGVAGALKNALDWLVGTGELYGRPVAVIAAGTTGGEHGRRDLVRTLTWQGAHVVTDLGIGAPRTKAHADGRYTDAATIAALQSLAATVGAAPTMATDARLSLVGAVVERAGVAPGHVAPVPAPLAGPAAHRPTDVA